MRALKILFAAVVVAAAIFFGVFALIGIAVLGLIALVVQSFRRPATVRTPRPPPGPGSGSSAPRPRPPVSGDVIDVEATEKL